MNLRNIIVYIAGPYRGTSDWAVEQNVRRAEKLALDVWEAGFTAFCPHKHTRHFCTGGRKEGAGARNMPDTVWMAGGLVMLRRCDVILTVEDWEGSEGTERECQEARQHGIPIFATLQALKQKYANGEKMACEGTDCEREAWFRGTRKARVNRWKTVIEAKLAGGRRARPLSDILGVRPEEIPVEADIAVRELKQEGVVEETEAYEGSSPPGPMAADPVTGIKNLIPPNPKSF